MSVSNTFETNGPVFSRLNRRYIVSKCFESYLKMSIRPPNDLSLIPGYLHPLEARFLFWLAGKVPSNGLALEVGSYKGKSSAYIAAGLKSTASLACVDTWRNDAMPYDQALDVMPEFLQNVRCYQNAIETHRGESTEVAAKWSRPIDLLFIDGDHSYKGCTTDLKAWFQFVRTGGWIAFHDSSEPGVSRAIEELFPRSERASERYAWSILAATKK